MWTLTRDALSKSHAGIEHVLNIKENTAAVWKILIQSNL